MKRIAVGLIGLIVFVLSLPFLQCGVQFAWHYRDIGRVVAMADSEEQTLPQPIKNMLLHSLHQQTSPYAARLLVQQFYSDSFAGHMWKWQIANLSWTVLLSATTSERDRLAIIAHYGSMGGGHFGLSNTSQVMFGLPLSQLSEAQAATLVQLSKAPSLYRHQQDLERRRDEFLSHYQNSTRQQPSS